MISVKSIEQMTTTELELNIALLEGWNIEEIIDNEFHIKKELKVEKINSSFKFLPLIAPSIIQREKIKEIKINKSNEYYYPVFEVHNKQYGFFKSNNYFKSAMQFYLAKKLGVIS